MIVDDLHRLVVDEVRSVTPECSVLLHRPNDGIVRHGLPPIDAADPRQSLPRPTSSRYRHTLHAARSRETITVRSGAVTSVLDLPDLVLRPPSVLSHGSEVAESSTGAARRTSELS